MRRGLVDMNTMVKAHEDRILSASLPDLPSTPGGKGAFTPFTRFSVTDPFSQVNWTAPVLRRVYQKSAAVRSCVDAIVRQISTLDWEIVAIASAKSRKVKPNLAMVDYVTNFLSNPNINKTTFRELLAAALTDVLVLDFGAIEKVFSERELRELWVRDGGTISGEYDEHGVLLQYWQQRATALGADATDPIKFYPNELVELHLYPQTDTSSGRPPIESILDEIAALLLSTKNIAQSFVLNEIPPGILHLDGIGREAYERVKAEFRAGRLERDRIRMFANVKEVKWIELRKPNREQQLDELRNSIESVVYRTFGLSPVGMGKSEVNRATGLAQLENQRSTLFEPIVNMLQEAITQDIVWEFDKDLQFRFIVPMTSDEQEFVLNAIGKALPAGVVNIDYIRRLMHEDPIPGGDVYSFRLPTNEFPFRVDALTRLGSATPAQSPPKPTPSLVRPPVVAKKFDDLQDSLRIALERHWQNAARTRDKHPLPEVLAMLAGKMSATINETITSVNDMCSLQARMQGEEWKMIERVSADSIKSLLSLAITSPDDLVLRHQLPSALAKTIIPTEVRDV